MKIERIYDNLNQYITTNKVLLLYGPRQAGKTTLLENFLKTYPKKYRLENGDDIRISNLFAAQDLKKLNEYAENVELLAIDEAQRIPKIGIALKMLIDHNKHLTIIATGSSSFELAGQVGEPLTGRKKTLTLYPVSQLELSNQFSNYELRNQLQERLILGSYPEVIAAKNVAEKRNIISEITNSYLLKDILTLERVKSPRILSQLLQLLAFQIGSEVSQNELATQLGIDRKTVARYLDLLEKSFVIYELSGFSRNLRKEITKKSKYYFLDNGIRNALLANFNSLDLRNDIGMLWENFMVTERLKTRSYQSIYANDYFWRTWDQQEIDLIEEHSGKLFAYEFKWKKTKTNAPKDWHNNYPNSNFEIISQDNYLDFLLPHR